MTLLLEDDDMETVTPDAWASSVVDSKAKESRYIAALTEAYRANGGQIMIVAPGATGLDEGVSFIYSGSKLTVDKSLKAHRERYSAASMAARLTRDSETVTAISNALTDATSLSGLARAAGITATRCARFLKAAFQDDARAIPFIPRRHDEKRKAFEAELVPKLKDAKEAGILGLHQIAKYCGTTFETVRQLDAKYGLKLPRGNGANKRRYRAQIAEDAQ